MFHELKSLWRCCSMPEKTAFTAIALALTFKGVVEFAALLPESASLPSCGNVERYADTQVSRVVHSQSEAGVPLKMTATLTFPNGTHSSQNIFPSGHRCVDRSLNLK